MITLGKEGSLAARRRAMGLHLRQQLPSTSLFDKAQERYGGAPGWLHPDHSHGAPSRRQMRDGHSSSWSERPAQVALCLQYARVFSILRLQRQNRPASVQATP